MRIITNIAGVITDHGAMVTVVMRMFSSVCSSWWPLDTDVWDQYLKMIINSQHPWTLKMFFIIDCSSLYCDVCPGDLSSDCQWLETGEMIGSNVSNVHTVTSIIIIILDILIFSINNFLTTPHISAANLDWSVWYCISLYSGAGQHSVQISQLFGLHGSVRQKSKLHSQVRRETAQLMFAICRPVPLTLLSAQLAILVEC